MRLGDFTDPAPRARLEDEPGQHAEQGKLCLVAWCVLFVGVAIWRFRREEF